MKTQRRDLSKRVLALGGRLDRYVGSLFVASYVTAFLLVIGIFLVLDMAAQIDEFLEPWPDGTRVSTGIIARYYVVNIPFLYLQVAPMVTLIAGMFTISRLIKNNETVAALGAGVSSQRLLLPLFAGSIAVAVGMFGLREWATTSVGYKRDALFDVLENQRYERVYEGVWVRGMDGSIARLGEFRPRTGNPPVAEIRDLRANVRAGDGFVRIEAPLCVWAERDGQLGWWLKDGKRHEVRGAQVVRKVDRLEDFPFTPDTVLTFHRARTNPLELSFGQARELARRDPDNVTYQTLLQYHLSFPLANIVLLLVGMPLLLRSRRGRRAEGLIFGFLLCIFYLSADFVFRGMGLEGGIHPLMAGWVPLLFFGSLGAVLFESTRT